jgi:hypothetical protein
VSIRDLPNAILIVLGGRKSAEVFVKFDPTATQESGTNRSKLLLLAL